MDVALLVVYLLIALLFSFLCSIFEAVLLSIRRPYIETQRVDRPRNAALWTEHLTDINRPLSAILILNTVAHTVGAAGVGAQAIKVFGEAPLTTGLISAILTILILVLSEIIPKTLGAVYWKQLAGTVGILLRWLTLTMTPIIWVTEKITSGMSHGEKKGAYSRAEFIAMANIGEQEGAIEKTEGRIVKNLFGLRNTAVSHAATPSTVVFALPGNCTVAEFAEKHADRPFSRIPIYGESIDDLEGFVLQVEILQAHGQGESEAPLRQFARPLHTVSNEQSLAELFDTMIAERIHIAATIDPFGALSGIITLEDVIETLLGMEIVDEVDDIEDMQQMARDLWKKRAAKMGLKVEEATSPAPSEPLPAPPSSV
ncbi:CNNM domain-containing protein [Roseibacillus ishigakijimensis]|uniref:HlyC/CorC family transporter n=1 Tax=Roseibacillus ishigakijimensis TaxID=454146 RepID=A0A934VHL4_9BACT|nr:hemolysin family protein [Roseibacillus ishigakijimensis]MBK1834093.1 HlyC/CorC family transporter [Roseibacillus ishigakijimensis]